MLNNPVKSPLLLGLLKWVVVLFAVAVAFFAAALFKGGGERKRDLLSLLPGPDERAPFMLINSSGGFPGSVFRFFADSSTISPEGSVISALVPIFESAPESAVVILERETGLAIYGAFSLGGEERAALAAGALPDRWARHFVMPQVSRLEGGLLRVMALNSAAPFYVDVGDRMANIADSLADIERMRRVRSRAEKGVDLEWSLEGDWPCRALLSDGGVLGAISAGTDDPSYRMSPVTLEAAWRRSAADPAVSSGDETILAGALGEARWRVRGLEIHL
ncbi:MAG: hypothetical protein LBS93_06595, partial [Synergistaceae bacterium]|nr:hypothetical protein [Synergistaceae bacterium]